MGVPVRLYTNRSLIGSYLGRFVEIATQPNKHDQAVSCDDISHAWPTAS